MLKTAMENSVIFDVCSKQYKTKKTLKVHTKCMHSRPGEMLLFPCDLCDLKATQQSHLGASHSDRSFESEEI
jgi:hypothetical protein